MYEFAIFFAKRFNLNIPVVQSIFSGQALQPFLNAHYSNLGKITSCQLIYHGLNDIYLVQSLTGKYVLRVYRAGWRSHSAILFELDLLKHIAAKGVAVAEPLPTATGEYLLQLSAPEGLRQAVLFTFAAGSQLRYEAAQAWHYGQVVADFHNALTDFSSPHPRFALDLAHLVAEPLSLIEPLFQEQLPGEWAYIQAFYQDVLAKVKELEKTGLERGVCHGDLHAGNAHYAPESGRLTLLDFDCAGVDGWRAYELAVYWWACRLRLDKEAAPKVWQAYLKGYTEKRNFGANDLAAVPLFFQIRQLWIGGIVARHGANNNHELLSATQLQSFVAFLQNCEKGEYAF